MYLNAQFITSLTSSIYLLLHTTCFVLEANRNSLVQEISHMGPKVPYRVLKSPPQMPIFTAFFNTILLSVSGDLQTKIFCVGLVHTSQYMLHVLPISSLIWKLYCLVDCELWSSTVCNLFVCLLHHPVSQDTVNTVTAHWMPRISPAPYLLGTPGVKLTKLKADCALSYN